MILHQLNAKPNTIKSHKIQGNKLKQLQHFLSWNKANIKYSCKSQLYNSYKKKKKRLLKFGLHYMIVVILLKKINIKRKRNPIYY